MDSDDVPLVSPPRKSSHKFPYSGISHLSRTPTTRNRAMSDPATPRSHQQSSPAFTPRTEKRALNQMKADKRKATIEENRKKATTEAVRTEFEEELRKADFFDGLLESLTEHGYTLADFLDYVFNPENRLPRDYRWKGFFRQKATVLRILGYWCTSRYSKTVRHLLYDWAITLVGKIVRGEARKITEFGILRTMGKTINENFFLSYSLAKKTTELMGLAPAMFSIIGCFSSTPRQLREMKPKSLERKVLVSYS